MIKTATLDKDQKPTDEMLREIREAAKKEIGKSFSSGRKKQKYSEKNDGILKKIYLCFIMKAHKILEHLVL